MSYRFGVSDNASQAATLRGDSIFYNPASCFVEEFDAPGSIVLTHPANP